MLEKDFVKNVLTMSVVSCFSRKDSLKQRSNSPKSSPTDIFKVSQDSNRDAVDNGIKKSAVAAASKKATEVTTATKRTSTVFGKKQVDYSLVKVFNRMCLLLQARCPNFAI